jgi:signal transduction histidine kinase/ActR/RegA family two-component response regulator
MQRWCSLFLPRSPKSLAWLAIMIVFAIGFLALIGWMLNITLLKSVKPGWIRMSVITATCLILAALELALRQKNPSTVRQSLILQTPGILVGMVGLLTIVLYVVAIYTGEEPSPGDGLFLNLLWAPGTRITLLTAVLFLIVGCALVLLATGNRRASDIAHALTLPAAMASYLVPVSYLLGVQGLHRSVQVPAALPTGIALCALSVAIFCARPDTWLMRVFTADHAGGIMARRILPALLIIPLLIAWLDLYGGRAGAFGSEVGVALVALAYTFCLLWLVWKTARSVNETDDRRRQAEEALRRARDQLEVRVLQRTRELNETNEAMQVEIRDRIKAEEGVKAERQRLSDVLGVLPVYVVLLTPDYHVPFANRFFEGRFGVSDGRRCFEYLFGRAEPCEKCETYNVLKTNAPHHWEWTGPDGRSYDVHDFPFTDTDGSRLIMEVGIDITERKQLEAQLLQTQKMEAIGTLAGGIAHDFNNILMAMMGFSELAMDDVPAHANAQRHLKRVFEAGLRGRDLVRQILAFSRKTEGERRGISLTPLVAETHALLRSSLPSTIQMPLAITTSDDYVLADPIQMQQVLMNLATNAAYAMRERGGELTIGLSSATFPPGSIVPDPDMEPGTYVKLRVTDTGTGMAEEVRQRIFEPFFTTKEPGKGTGMGLAVVYGVVKNHGGAVTVLSAVGQGSIFEVFLPKAQRPDAKKEETATTVLPTGTERVLFIDDEEILVEMVRSMLDSLGYQVTVAANGSEAWNLFLDDPTRFDLVITDQTMPDGAGLTLARRMLGVRKELPIILCTGYSETVSAEEAKEAGVREFLMKPVVKKELAEVIRRALDARPG